MCDLEVDLTPYGGRDAFPDASAALAPLARDGIVSINGDLIRVPPAMRQFCRLAAMAFDAYADTGAPHSRAI